MEDGMKARGAAVALGAAAAIATFVVIRRDFGEGLSAFGLGANAPAAAEDALRFVWALCGAISAFAASTLVIATLAGLVEVTRVRRRVDALRHGPAADHWNMADWRSAFASSAVADRAEAMIATIGLPRSQPVSDRPGRRVVVDTNILVGLDDIWLDRLTLNRVIGPLGPILLGLGVTAACLAAATGGRWELALAAGTTGWLIVRLTLYLGRLALGAGVMRAIDAATAAIRPLTAFDAVESAPPTGRPPFESGLEVGEFAAALADLLADPLARLAEAADTLAASAPAAGERSMEDALARIRAGIERLLESSGPGPN